MLLTMRQIVRIEKIGLDILRIKAVHDANGKLNWLEYIKYRVQIQILQSRLLPRGTNPQNHGEGTHLNSLATEYLWEM